MSGWVVSGLRGEGGRRSFVSEDERSQRIKKKNPLSAPNKFPNLTDPAIEIAKEGK